MSVYVFVCVCVCLCVCMAQPTGTLGLTGLYVESIFLKDALKR